MGPRRTPAGRSSRPKIDGAAFTFTVGPLGVSFADPKRTRQCVDVLGWHADITLDGEPAGRMHLFEIDHPRLRDRGVALGSVLTSCVGGAYQQILSPTARELWAGQSRLVALDTLRLFPNVRGQGHSLDVVRSTVDQFRMRGAGAIVIKAVPLQYVDGASATWESQMGATIGSRPWFVRGGDGDHEAFEKVANHWRKLGWREISSGSEPVFLLELAK